MIVSDNGTELTSNAILRWCSVTLPGRGMQSMIQRGGRPMQNGFVESFNGRMRDELLDETMFRNLAHALTKSISFASQILQFSNCLLRIARKVS